MPSNLESKLPTGRQRRLNNNERIGKEVRMNWNTWIRQTHRWVAIAFTATVVANFIVLARGNGAPPPWVTYSPLLPLALLLFSGLYLFVLPYSAQWRTRRRT
jgi:hypothetical protein